MDLRTFLSRLRPEERRRFAERSQTQPSYLPQLKGGHARPSPRLARRMVEASREFRKQAGGELTLRELRPDVFGDLSHENALER